VLNLCRFGANLNQYVDRLFKGDCTEVMKGLPEGSVDLIVTSPPYADNRKSTYGGVPVKRYVEWFLPISEQLRRVLKPDGSFILNIKERVVQGERGVYVYELVMAMRNQGWRWTEEYVWHKKNTYPGKWPNRFRDLWEHCYHFTRSSRFRMYQDAVKVPIGTWAEKRLANLSETDKIRDESRTMSGFGKNVSKWVGRDTVYPGNVLHLATESSNVNHSATFPVDLPAWFIKLFTREGALVLDPFMGSGTTAIAALRLGRHFVGIELNDEYHEVALERIARERQRLEAIARTNDVDSVAASGRKKRNAR
jgi:site-specific DNA-methyltransferase (adenine-specific)/site-specific DNA-methyltransferase (cytosine-N4-specific)